MSTRWSITLGTRGDYDALAHWHYRGGSPRSFATVLTLRAGWGGRAERRAMSGEKKARNARREPKPRSSEPEAQARDGAGEHSQGEGRASTGWKPVPRGQMPRGPATTGEVLGVLVASRPVLNGPWREAAWPGWLAGQSKRVAAGRINRELRVISRVVVDPRVRGMGAATALIARYLRQHATRRTEVIAAMAWASPVFERAGMRAVPVPMSRRDAALRRGLARLGIEPEELACPARVRRSRALARVLRAWAKASRATRGIAGGRLGPIMARASASAWPRVVLVHERGGAAKGARR
jgi:GNAT superfamily N-acetyltransferase